jgi:hypothetical protein
MANLCKSLQVVANPSIVFSSVLAFHSVSSWLLSVANLEPFLSYTCLIFNGKTNEILTFRQQVQLLDILKSFPRKSRRFRVRSLLHVQFLDMPRRKLRGLNQPFGVRLA